MPVSAVTIRPFAPDDLTAVVALWNRCLPRDPLSEDRFWRQILLDPNFEPSGALVAWSSETIVGFLQTIVRRVPLGSGGVSPETGWLTVFFVHPEYRRRGVGSALLAAGLEYLRAKGRKRVMCNGYAPYYFFPGVDVDYAEAHDFLKSHGFTAASEAVAMGLSLETVVTPPEVRETEAVLAGEGLAVRWFTRCDTLPLLAFAEEHFAHWQPSILEGLQQGNEEILLAVDQGEVVAFAQWQNPHNDPPNGAAGRFGPFGVRPDLRGRGIGAVVFYRLIERVKAEGARYLWFGWAGGRNLTFYERVGCRVTRRFRLFWREL